MMNWIDTCWTSTQPLLLYDPLLFLLIYLNHIRLHKTLSYCSYSQNKIYFTDIKTYIYVIYYYVFIYYYYYPALGALNISFCLALYHRHSIITIQFSHIYWCILYIVHCHNKLGTVLGSQKNTQSLSLFTIKLWCHNAHDDIQIGLFACHFRHGKCREWILVASNFFLPKVMLCFILTESVHSIVHFGRGVNALIIISIV